MQKLKYGSHWGYSETLYAEDTIKNDRIDGYWICKTGSKTNFAKRLNVIRNGEGNCFAENWVFDRIGDGANSECIKILEQYPNQIILVEDRAHKILKRFDMDGKLLDDPDGRKLF